VYVRMPLMRSSPLSPFRFAAINSLPLGVTVARQRVPLLLPQQRLRFVLLSVLAPRSTATVERCQPR